MSKIYLMIFLLCLSVISQAGTWRRLDAQTIQFLGNIEIDEYEKFQKVFDENVTKLIVTSGGGHTEPALAISEKLEKQNFTIIVRTWCLSSCANYFFTAAKKKVIEKGIVGFHGSPMGCHKNPNWMEETKKSIFDQILKMGHTPEQAQLSFDEFIKHTTASDLQEKNFFSRLGISPVLFERSCTGDKGMNNGKLYSYLLPKPETFSKYGIDNVTGDQDEDTILWYSGDLLVD